MKHHKKLPQKTLQIIINLKTSSNIQKRAWILSNFLKIFNRLASIFLFIFFKRSISSLYRHRKNDKDNHAEENDKSRINVEEHKK